MLHATRGRTGTPPNPIRRTSPRRWLLVHGRRDTDETPMMWLGNLGTTALGPPPLSGPATALWARHRRDGDARARDPRRVPRTRGADRPWWRDRKRGGWGQR